MQRSWFHQWLRRIARSQSAGQCGQRPSARLQIETLENRLTPAVTIANMNGVLTVNCNGTGPNQVILDHSGSQTIINALPFADSTFSSIAINGNVSRNTLLLRTTVKRVEVNAGSDQTDVTVGLVANQLTQQAPINIHSTSGLVSLTINDQGTPTTEIYTLSATSFTRTNGGVNPINWSGNSLFLLTVNTGSNVEFINVNDTAFVSTVVNGGPMRDQIVIAGAGRSLTANTGTGSATVLVADSGHRLANVGNVAVHGQGRDDQLVLDDSGLATSATYTVFANSVSRAGVGTISYTGINFFRLNTGRAADTINIESTGAATTQINAGPAGNGINVHGATGNLVVNTGGANATVNVGSAGNQLSFVGAVTVNGQASPATLNVNDQNLGTAETYTITSTSVARTGFVGSLTCGGITALNVNTGSAGEAVHVVRTASGVTTTINDGPGGDVVTTTSAQQGALRVMGQGGTTTLVVDDSAETTPLSYSLSGVSVARVSVNSVSIRYSGLGSLQLFTGQAAGNVINLNSTAAGVDAQITTQSDANLFQLFGGGPFAGPLTLNGSGTDKLAYLSFTSLVYVNLQTGEATDLAAISGIRDVAGGQGTNILVGDGHGNTLDASHGGRSLLIAGGSDFSGQGDTLIGGSDNAILIAGFTDYDMDKFALLAIMGVWAGPDSYAARVAALTTDNRLPFLDATTVHSNGGNNVLLGNSGLDLFFANPDNDQINADPNTEFVVAIS